MTYEFNFIFDKDNKNFNEDPEVNRMFIMTEKRYAEDLRMVMLSESLLDLCRRLGMNIEPEAAAFGWRKAPVKFDIVQTNPDGSLIIHMECELLFSEVSPYKVKGYVEYESSKDEDLRKKGCLNKAIEHYENALLILELEPHDERIEAAKRSINRQIKSLNAVIESSEFGSIENEKKILWILNDARWAKMVADCYWSDLNQFSVFTFKCCLEDVANALNEYGGRKNESYEKIFGR